MFVKLLCIEARAGLQVSSEVEVGEGTYSKYQTDRFEDQIDYAADRRYDRSLRCEAGRAG